MKIRRMITLSLINAAQTELTAQGYTSFTFVPKGEDDLNKEIVLPADFTDSTKQVRLPAGALSVASRRAGKKTGIGSETETGFYLVQLLYYAETTGQLYDLLDVFDTFFKKDSVFKVYDFTSTGYPPEALPDPSYYMNIQSPQSRDISTWDENAAKRHAGMTSFMGEVVT